MRKDGERFSISLQIGMPYLRTDFPDSWSYPVALTPPYPRLLVQTGVDSFQALCMASRLAITLLTHFREGGGKLLCSDGTDFPLEAYLPISKLPGNNGA